LVLVRGSFLLSCALFNPRTGAGVESMTHGYGAAAAPSISDEVLSNQDAEDCLLPMGITSENVAKEWGVTRQVQDAFAARSFQKAAAANKAGKFKDEIVPIKAKVYDPKTEKEFEIVVDQDDGIRDGVTAESLAKLKPAFAKDGTTHAGSSFFLRLSHVILTETQAMPRKSLMVLLRFSLPAVPSQRSSACPLLESS